MSVFGLCRCSSICWCFEVLVLVGVVFSLFVLCLSSCLLWCLCLSR